MEGEIGKGTGKGRDSRLYIVFGTRATAGLYCRVTRPYGRKVEGEEGGGWSGCRGGGREEVAVERMERKVKSSRGKESGIGCYRSDGGIEIAG